MSPTGPCPLLSTTIGRFLKTDPIGFDGGLNLYTYVGNDPLNKTDPMGTSPDTTQGSGAGSILVSNASGDYAYTGNDPLNLVDPMGTSSDTTQGAAGDQATANGNITLVAATSGTASTSGGYVLSDKIQGQLDARG